MEIYEEKIRTDYEPIRNAPSRLGFEKGRIGRVSVSPLELAAYKLYKVLEKYPDFTKEARSQIQEEYKNFEGLDTLNLEVFASVLTFLKYHKPSPENFKDEVISEYFSRLTPTNATDKNRTLRLKAEFLKYIVAIKEFKKDQEEEEEYQDDEYQDDEYQDDEYEDEYYDESE